MVIKCIKQKIKNDDENTIYNNDISDYVSIGDEFLVFGMSFVKRNCYLYIYNSEHLFEAHKDLFEIVDSKPSRYWDVKFWSNGDVTLWPKLFYDEDFIANFAEREQFERKQFKELLDRFEEEKHSS